MLPLTQTAGSRSKRVGAAKAMETPVQCRGRRERPAWRGVSIPGWAGRVGSMLPARGHSGGRAPPGAATRRREATLVARARPAGPLIGRAGRSALLDRSPARKRGTLRPAAGHLPLHRAGASSHRTVTSKLKKRKATGRRELKSIRAFALLSLPTSGARAPHGRPVPTARTSRVTARPVVVIQVATSLLHGGMLEAVSPSTGAGIAASQA